MKHIITTMNEQHHLYKLVMEYDNKKPSSDIIKNFIAEAEKDYQKAEERLLLGQYLLHLREDDEEQETIRKALRLIKHVEDYEIEK